MNKTTLIILLVVGIFVAFVGMLGLLGGGLYFYYSYVQPQQIGLTPNQIAALSKNRPTVTSENDAVTSNSAHMAPLDRPLVDIDKLASRITSNHNLYLKFRDQALAAYSRHHPKTSPYDDRVRAIIRFSCYWAIWGDPYGEGLWNKNQDYAVAARQQGCDDPVVDLMLNFDWFNGKNFDYSQRFQDLTIRIKQISRADYPAIICLEGEEIAWNNLIAYKVKYNLTQDDPACASTLPTLLNLWGQSYRELIQLKTPNALLFVHGGNLQDSCSENQESLDLAIAKEDETFNESDADNPIKLSLDGKYFTEAAWCARGTGFANTVTADGWRLFADRLNQARGVLEPAYDRFPREESISRLMMRVALGEQSGRDEMEKWFQRGVSADPHCFAVYSAKEWFLQPRWYGSIDDLLSFGQECVKTQDWKNTIPMVFTYSIAQADQLEHNLYTRDNIWTPIEKTYRDFLSRYPNSVSYRTQLALHAYEGNHWDVATEQFKILGDDWGRDFLSEQNHTRIIKILGIK